MSFGEIWVDKIDSIDTIYADDINQLAAGIISNESAIEELHKKNNFDIVLSTSTAMKAYENQTISGKTIFFQTNQTITSEQTFQFSHCVIYGNGKLLDFQGSAEFTDCEIYDLNVNTTGGTAIYTGCSIYSGQISVSFSPGFTNSHLSNCIIASGDSTIYTINSIYHQCDMCGGSPYVDQYADVQNEYNYFVNCIQMSGYYAITGKCFFSGCDGSVLVADSATLKPGTTTAFSDQNFATLTIVEGE